MSTDFKTISENGSLNSTVFLRLLSHNFLMGAPIMIIYFLFLSKAFHVVPFKYRDLPSEFELSVTFRIFIFLDYLLCVTFRCQLNLFFYYTISSKNSKVNC